MADVIKRSKNVFAALSDEFFESKYCEKEIAAAKEKGLMVVPLYSGAEEYNHHQLDKRIKIATRFDDCVCLFEFISKWFKTETTTDDDLSYGYTPFTRNTRDILKNKNATATKNTLDELVKLVKKKINGVERY